MSPASICPEPPSSSGLPILSPQNRQRSAVRLISAPHIGQGRVSPDESFTVGGSPAPPEPAITAGVPPASTSSTCAISISADTASADGTVSDSPQPGHLASTPALSSEVLRTFWHDGH